MLKWIIVGIALLLTAIAMVPIAVTYIEKQQARDNAEKLAHAKNVNQSEAKTAVIVFSRSGNTAVLAQHIAQQWQADFYRLEASDYELGLKGWTNAMQDARSIRTEISPRQIDLSAYNTIYLGSPIWLYSPAPPIWAFVENNNFQGKHVVFFNTFNSKFEQTYIDQFKQLLLDKGAISFEHRHVKRGRMGQQISTEVMLEIYDNYPSKNVNNKIE
ncbi:flavodoxin family protein [Cellvibrio mixtus]|uniref:flavodoxin family protein n=1 Tax=Cellvibrio mixtus TaxID=39650 RepID=UPI0005880400|nr:flavodoxin [Cellvibrio mixtus]